jgi:hypothetical protein
MGRSMDQGWRWPRSLGLLAGLAVAVASGRAEAAWPEGLQEGLSAARAVEQDLLDEARRAIVIGGVVLYRHRHAVAGAAMGCVAGSMAATTLSLGAGLATGGAALVGTGPAAALGCGLGALGGGVLGQPLDDVDVEP